MLLLLLSETFVHLLFTLPSRLSMKTFSKFFSVSSVSPAVIRVFFHSPHGQSSVDQLSGSATTTRVSQSYDGGDTPSIAQGQITVPTAYFEELVLRLWCGQSQWRDTTSSVAWSKLTVSMAYLHRTSSLVLLRSRWTDGPRSVARD